MMVQDLLLSNADQLYNITFVSAVFSMQQIVLLCKKGLGFIVLLRFYNMVEQNMAALPIGDVSLNVKNQEWGNIKE
jgi:hypothetical protein